jgi:UDP:flavonoid glycosyltransferase YjiC (YdhE family)
MRILFSSTSGVGHVEPMIPLAVALQQRGHDLRWATAQDARPRLERRGIPTVKAGMRAAEGMTEYRQRWPEARQLSGPPLGDHVFPKLFGAIAAPAALPDLVAAVATWRPDIVVHDAADLAAPILAHMLGVPNATHSFGSILSKQRVSGAAAETEALWAEAGLEMPSYGGCYDHLYIDIYPPSLQPDDMSHVGRISRLRPRSNDPLPGEDLPPDLAAALSTGRPLIYVTFGTVVNTAAAFGTAVAAVTGMDALVVVTVGANQDPEVLGPLPDNVHATRFIPQSILLPRCSAVISHAGSGTLLAALAHGLPQVCIPQAADQFRNADACASAGAGIALQAEAATESAIGEAIRRILAEPGFRGAARKVQAEIAIMPSAETVAETLEQLP